ncbi:MAG: hypothetical protein RJB39_281 [Candidatus Parcubacteria bacterium]|jgi:16S rRNA (uracil1498-N3)-methyltransferase
MRIHRFYIKDLTNVSSFIEDEDIIHQLSHVFRYKTGDTIAVFNESLGEWEAEIIDFHKKKLSFKFTKQIKDGLHTVVEGEAATKKTTLFMSIIKNSNFDLVVEKSTELGVGEIVPILAERTVKTSLNYDRLNKIIKEATEQSGRIDLMKIGDILTLNDAISQSKLYSEQVFFGHINSANMSHLDSAKSSALFIGPEGGWTDAEVENFIKENILPFSLGQYILRAETAAIVGGSKMVGL